MFLRLRYFFDTLQELVRSQLKARYKHTVLGFGWLVLQPLVQMLVLGFVFQYYVPVDIDNYFLFLFTGLLPWNFFSQSVTTAAYSLATYRGLIQKTGFPRQLLPISLVAANGVYFVSALLVLAGYVLVSSFGVMSFSVLVSKVVVLLTSTFWLGVLTIGISLLTAVANVVYKDSSFLVGSLLTIGFYATPIIYSLEFVPDSLLFISFLNPMTIVAEAYKFVFLGRFWQMSFELGLVSFCVGSILVYGGWFWFEKMKHRLDDLL